MNSFLDAYRAPRPLQRRNVSDTDIVEFLAGLSPEDHARLRVLQAVTTAPKKPKVPRPGKPSADATAPQRGRPSEAPESDVLFMYYAVLSAVKRGRDHEERACILAKFFREPWGEPPARALATLVANVEAARSDGPQKKRTAESWAIAALGRILEAHGAGTSESQLKRIVGRLVAAPARVV